MRLMARNFVLTACDTATVQNRSETDRWPPTVVRCAPYKGPKRFLKSYLASKRATLIYSSTHTNRDFLRVLFVQGFVFTLIIQAVGKLIINEQESNVLYCFSAYKIPLSLLFILSISNKLFLKIFFFVVFQFTSECLRLRFAFLHFLNMIR